MVELSSPESELALVDFSDEQETKQTISIGLLDELEPGKRYKISMKFIAILNEEARGFYRASYIENNVTKYLLQLDKIH